MATGTGYSTATGFASAAPPAGNPFIGATMLAWTGTVQPAVANQWNLSVQKELANNTTLQVGYVGQRTTHLMVPEWLSQGDLQSEWHHHLSIYRRQKSAGTSTALHDRALLVPIGFGNVKNTASVGNMNYNAMQVVLQKRYGNGLQGQVSYTFQKCMTNDDGYYGTWGGTTQAATVRQLLAKPLQPQRRLCAMLLGHNPRPERIRRVRAAHWPWQTVWPRHADGAERGSRQLVDQPYCFLAYRVPALYLRCAQLGNRQSGESS